MNPARLFNTRTVLGVAIGAAIVVTMSGCSIPVISPVPPDRTDTAAHTAEIQRWQRAAESSSQTNTTTTTTTTTTLSVAMAVDTALANRRDIHAAIRDFERAHADQVVARAALAKTLVDATESVRTAYFEAIAAGARAAATAVMADAAGAAAELANRFYAAGNLPERELLAATSAATERRIEAGRAGLEAEQARLHLAEAMGVAHIAATQLPREMPELPSENLDRSAFLSRALANDPELVALEREGYALDWEKSRDRQNRLLPRKIASNADLQQARRRAITTETDSLLSELRQLREAEVLAQTLIPRQERLIQLEAQRYNFMLSGIEPALEARIQEQQARAELAEIRLAWWQARRALAIRVGGLPEPTVETTAAPSAATPAPEAPSAHEHHH